MMCMFEDMYWKLQFKTDLGIIFGIVERSEDALNLYQLISLWLLRSSISIICLISFIE